MKPERKRLFFALWPDEGVRDVLYSLAVRQHKTCGGRLVRKQNIHLTLLFLGAVAVERVPAIINVAASIRLSAFALKFDALGYWRRNRILWAAPRRAPPSLKQLVDVLAGGLCKADISPAVAEGRSYKPHVTLIRDAVSQPSLPTMDIGWPVRDFALIESVPGGSSPVYRTLARWALESAIHRQLI